MRKIKRREQKRKDKRFQENANFHIWEIEALRNV